MEIELRDITFNYKKVNYKSKLVIKNLNMKINPGISAIIGDNGSGKTTLLDIISGNLNIDKGEIRFSKKAKIGYVREAPDFVTSTVREELIYSMMEHNYKISEKRMLDVLMMVGIDTDLIDANIKDLTNSKKRLLDLACALIFNPNIILIDNLTDEMDDINKKRILNIIKILKTRFNKTIVIASNDINFIHKIADKVFVLYNENIVLEGSRYEVFKQEKLLKKYGVMTPDIIRFENIVLEKKGIKLGFRDEINDLIKDIYRNTY